MYRVNAYRFNHGEQYWREYYDRSDIIDEAADNKQEYVDYQQKHDRVVGETCEPVCDVRRNLRHCEIACEGHRKAYHKFCRSVDKPSRTKTFIDPLRVELLINEFPYDHRIDDGDDRSLRRCKDTAVNTAENDDRNEQRPEGVFEGLPYCRESWTF